MEAAYPGSGSVSADNVGTTQEGANASSWLQGGNAHMTWQVGRYTMCIHTLNVLTISQLLVPW